MINVGDIVRVKYNQKLVEILEIIAANARVRYIDVPPWGRIGQRYGVWQHLIDLEPVPSEAML